MAKRFEFATVKEKLDIAGHIYEVDCNSEVILNEIERFGDRCIELSKQPDEVVVAQGIAEMERMLDTVLGEGAADEIFSNRRKNYIDMLDVCTYVCESLIAARMNHTKSRINVKPSSKGNGKHHRGKPHKMKAIVSE